MEFLSRIIISVLFAAMPASGSYKLNNYGFGSGGTSNSTSTNYGLNATTGETSASQSTSATYNARSGNQNAQQANVPIVSLTNASNNYNRLKFIINPATNGSDAKFVVAVSNDNFVTTRYVQADNTLGNTKVYQTYASWGGATGQSIVGLSPSTTYAAKASAMQGSFTETEFGPASTAATVAPSISFDIDVSATNTSTSPPYVVTFPSLLINSVVTSNEKIWVSVDTNADLGAGVYITSANAGLRSTTRSFTLASASGDLAAASKGYGAQGSSVAQSSGGPFTISAPYNTSASTVGILDTSIRQIFSSSAPISGGRASLSLKAKANGQVPASTDYSDILTITTAGIF